MPFCPIPNNSYPADPQRILINMKTSARNLIDGKIVKVETDNIMAMVKVEIKPSVITSVITKESVDDLQLKVGDSVKVMVKSTSVMLVKE
jgi:molybdate transport system regulatory protein